jgi:site-specific DNA-methyltransferase (cytosine-N4-specific)
MKRQAIYTTAKNFDILVNEGREWNFHESNTTQHLHAIHPYPAKFIPQIPNKAISEWTQKGDIVYDPFCGCGTTLLEASLLGRPSIGTDNNSVAVLVSKAKTAQYTSLHIQALIDFEKNLDQLLQNSVPNRALIPNNKNFLYWFGDDVLLRLSTYKEVISKTNEPLRTLFLTIFSSIIVRVSYQDSDTRYARVARIVHPKDVDRLFRTKLKDVIKNLPILLTPGRSPVDVYQADARSVPFLDSKSVSLIVTSPPYLNAYDYHKYHRQRIHWIDGDFELNRDQEIGKHDEFTKPGATPDKYFLDMDSCFSEWNRVLKRHGRCLILIGDAIVNKSPVYVGDTFIDLMENRKLTLVKRWIRELQPTKRSFNVTNSRITHEHVLLFQKM